MAKLTIQKSRKTYTCCKCNKEIKKGELYKKITAMYLATKYVCEECEVSRSELTESEYLSWLYDLQDTFNIESSDDVNELINILDDQKIELEDKLDSIPEQLQDGQAGSILQERIEILDDAISDLEAIDFDGNIESNIIDHYEEKVQEAKDILLCL